jgi:(2Fe-2S) ferredoxin
MQKPKYHLLICSSSKLNGQQKGYCHSNEAVDIVLKFIEEIDERGLSGDVMVTNTGCFGICSSGPAAVVYPEGVWYGGITTEDVPEIVESHFENGRRVERLELK